MMTWTEMKEHERLKRESKLKQEDEAGQDASNAICQIKGLLEELFSSSKEYGYLKAKNERPP
ncbi:hypothetical protein AGMMS49921_02310 [Endomicrobiia bacterium]|nr:hypothetical protein AGMMS49921_02310 [Endomicrobiia bacterium]